jgi:hypothetical protein
MRGWSCSQLTFAWFTACHFHGISLLSPGACPYLVEPYGKRVGPLSFEFRTFNKSTYSTRSDFISRLDPFLKSLPHGLQYAVEIRNHPLA